jgi:hypothetical protein
MKSHLFSKHDLKESEVFEKDLKVLFGLSHDLLDRLPEYAFRALAAPTPREKEDVYDQASEDLGVPRAKLDHALNTTQFFLRELASSTDRQIAEKFSRLADEWRSRAAYASSILQIATAPEYQQIIGMGRAVLPLILHELAVRPDHWFWALKAITGEDPVPDQDRGDFEKMTGAWLSWGAANGYRI